MPFMTSNPAFDPKVHGFKFDNHQVPWGFGRRINIGTQLCGAARRPDRGSGVIRAGPRHDPDPVTRRPFGDDLDGRGDESLALGFGQGGGFAGRAHRDDARDTSRDLGLDQGCECGFVNTPVAVWSDERCESTLKHRK